MDWLKRARESIAQTSLTNSKRPECFIEGVYPTHVSSGSDCFVYTEKGRYIDFISALGTNLFGYGNPYIANALRTQLSHGWLYSLGSQCEVEAAESIKDKLSFVSKVRFLKTGTEAAMGAVRIARAHTGRSRVLTEGYHGHADGFISLTPPAYGVRDTFDYMELTETSQIDDTVACVIIEPIQTDHSDGRIEYVKAIREMCKKHGVILIFDEIITGMRWPKLTFSSWSGIHPDIILLGKALAGGLPLSMIGLAHGIGENQEWFVSSTFAGDMLALRGMRKAIELLTTNSLYNIDDLWISAGKFIADFNSLYPKSIALYGYPTRSVFRGDPHTLALFWQESAKAKILLGPSLFFNFCHLQVKDLVINTFRDILIRIENGDVKLEGALPASPLSAQIRKV